MFKLAVQIKKKAGKAKSYDYMTTKEFYDELTADGAKYQYVEGKTPVLPTKEYAVDFEVTPADLKNVVIKVDRKEITNNTAMLTAGTYTVEVTADDCEPLSKEITISADIATHTQAFELAYKCRLYREATRQRKLQRLSTKTIMRTSQKSKRLLPLLTERRTSQSRLMWTTLW